MNYRGDYLVLNLAQLDEVADNFADYLSSLEGGGMMAERFCRRVLTRFAETKKEASEYLSRRPRLD